MSNIMELTGKQLDLISGGVGFDLTSGYGVVTAIQRGANPTPQPFTSGTNVPSQAASSFYNPSFVADGQYTAGISPYGSGNPKGNVGNS
jgi:hypothetical protein